MADTKITDLTSITGAVSTTSDVIVIVDVSDTTMAASGTDKKMTLQQLAAGLSEAGNQFLATTNSLSVYVTKALYDAQTVLAATSDNVPAAVTVAEETVIGRITAGNVTAVNPSAVAQTINTQTATLYTLVIGDAGKIVEVFATTTSTIMILPNTSVDFPVGTRIDLTSLNAGGLSIVGSSTVTVRVAATLTRVTRGQYALATIYQRAKNEWVLGGDLAT